MVLLGYAQGVATTAGSYAFSAASSYMFRSDASTSSATARGASPSSNSKSASTQPSPPSSPASRRLSLRRFPSQSRLPSASHPYLNGTASSSANRAIPETDESDRPPRGEAEDLVDELNCEDELYAILGVAKRAKTEEIRRAFLARSRVIHPDKLPFYPPATTAFQRLSYAYETLSKPSSRRLYDLRGGRGYDPGSPSAAAEGMADETLNGVLRNVINEFLNGDFEMIRVFATALNEGNPSLNLGDETVDSVEGAFRRVREVLLSGQRYLRLIKFELIRLYEIQSALRSLGYFDVYGRLRLTLALTRVTLEIPMVLDRAMRDELPAPAPPPRGLGAPGRDRGRDKENRRGAGAGGSAGGAGGGIQEGQLERRGLLGTKTRGMLVLTCKMLERAERWTGSPASAPATASSVPSGGGGGGGGGR
ncbi:hypothetical protein DMC30DRAFT_406111 [Rhodotorula diobovata]|uniref:J domain-containing protein n=1 Tax=Rhodotorula diobovata TaxID=5288 RepID=A0A5C5FKG4_9BASI|nr:hypothetical protein DMC30DRAFT_406111 [Rhodotorula diobovata]